MIRSFKGDWAEEVFTGICPKRFPANLQRTARRKLEAVNAAAKLEDLKAPPGNRLHPMHGDREGQYAIRINDQFRVCFVWQDSDAFNVEIVDYH
jgi:toxin HigB-1